MSADFYVAKRKKERRNKEEENVGSKANSFFFYHDSGKTSENRDKDRSWDTLAMVLI